MITRKPGASIDIGTSGIKLILKSQKKIKKMVFENYNNSLILEENVIDYNELADTVKRLLKKVKLTNKKVAISLSSENFIVRKMEIANVEKEEQEVLVESELEEIIADYNTDNYTTKLLICDETEESIGVITVTMPNGIIEKIIDIFVGHKIQLIKIVPDFVSLFNLIYYNFGTESVNLIIDIGAFSTNILLKSGDRLDIFRSIKMGGENFTKIIQNSLNLNFEEAEQVKKNLSIIDNRLQGIEVPEVKEGILNLTNSMVRKLENVKKFYLEQNRKSKIDSLIITGGGSLIDGFSDLLAKNLNLKIANMSYNDLSLNEKSTINLKQFDSALGSFY